MLIGLMGLGDLVGFTTGPRHQLMLEVLTLTIVRGIAEHQTGGQKLRHLESNLYTYSFYHQTRALNPTAEWDSQGTVSPLFGFQSLGSTDCFFPCFSLNNIN